MIGVPVRHEDARERTPGERPGHGIDVRRIADSRVDQRRDLPVEEPGVVAPARQRTRIVRLN